MKPSNYDEWLTTIDEHLQWKRRNRRINWYLFCFFGVFLGIDALNAWAKNIWLGIGVAPLHLAVMFLYWRLNRRLTRSIRIDERLRLDIWRAGHARSPAAFMFYLEQINLSILALEKLHGINTEVKVPDDNDDNEGEEWKDK